MFKFDGYTVFVNGLNYIMDVAYAKENALWHDNCCRTICTIHEF